MWRVIFLLLWLGGGAVTALAQQFRIVTWQIDHLPPVKAGLTNAPADEQRFLEIATILGGTDADAILLYGLQESEGARKIADLIKARKFSVTHHAVFRHGGPRGTVVGQPVAILSRREKMAGKSIDWANTGRIEMPGGFGFAVFRHGQVAVCLYVAGLPGSLTNGVSSIDGKYFARKRNYAAQFLGHHSTWLGTTFTNSVIATYLTGDFQLSPKGPVSDECAKILETAGFRALAPGTVTDKTTVSITNSLELDRVQDPIFTKGVEFIASRQLNRPAPEHPIIVCDLTFKTPGTTARAAAKPRPVPEPEPALAPIVVMATPLPAAPTNVPAAALSQPGHAADGANPVPAASIPVAADRRWIWWTTAGALGLALLGVVDRIWKARRGISIPPVPKMATAPLPLELPPASPGPALVSAEPSIPQEAATATGQTDRLPWENSAIRSNPGNPGHRMTPHLKQLMRDVVVGWLTRQRAHLLESHERGTEQVMELHARVEKIKEHFQERMRTQQQRIAELDGALRNKEKIILELIRAHRPETGS